MKKIISSIAISIAMICMFSATNPKTVNAKVSEDICIEAIVASCKSAIVPCGTSQKIKDEIYTYLWLDCEIFWHNKFIWNN